MTGDSCTTTDQYQKYADIVAKGANAMMSAMGFDKIAQGGLVLRQTLQMMGVEMRSVVTQIGEEPAPPNAFDIPADYKEVPMPGPQVRLSEPPEGTRDDAPRDLADRPAPSGGRLRTGAQPPRAGGVTVLKPARVFDGETMHEGWAVRVQGDRIEAVGPAASDGSPAATIVDLPGLTLLPGLVEGHSHVLLHPYDETSWNDQVLHESLGVRTARAVNHLRATLMAGFTTIRDLGTEGAGYADVELKQAVEQGIIPGPRMLVATRAIVATGSYGPKGFALEWRVPQGAEEADGVDSLMRVVRDQIGHGADWIKVYGDYRWGAARRSGARPFRSTR